MTTQRQVCRVPAASLYWYLSYGPLNGVPFAPCFGPARPGTLGKAAIAGCFCLLAFLPA
jgi:hypothetical protein